MFKLKSFLTQSFHGYLYNHLISIFSTLIFILLITFNYLIQLDLTLVYDGKYHSDPPAVLMFITSILFIKLLSATSFC